MTDLHDYIVESEDVDVVLARSVIRLNKQFIEPYCSLFIIDMEHIHEAFQAGGFVHI